MQVNKYDKITGVLRMLFSGDNDRYEKMLHAGRVNCPKCGSELVATKLIDSGYIENETTIVFTCPNRRFYNFHNVKEFFYLPMWSPATLAPKWWKVRGRGEWLRSLFKKLSKER
jgi:hypothetical protein